MKNNTYSKSSFTLPHSEAALILKLKKKLGFKSNTEVVRTALRELQNKVERERLKSLFAEASHLVRGANAQDMADLDALAAEGIE